MHHALIMNIERLLYHAKNAAILSQHDKRVGAIVLHNRQIVARGYNHSKTHPSFKNCRGFHCVHAECHALMKAGRGDTLVIVRILKNGRFSCSKPCQPCLEFATKYGIKTIIYTDWDESAKSITIA